MGIFASPVPSLRCLGALLRAFRDRFPRLYTALYGSAPPPRGFRSARAASARDVVLPTDNVGFLVDGLPAKTAKEAVALLNSVSIIYLGKTLLTREELLYMADRETDEERGES